MVRSFASAVGFATPVSLAKGGSLALTTQVFSTTSVDLFDELRAFLSVYKTTSLIKHVQGQTLNESHLSCAICLKDYAHHDQILDLDCGHRFHHGCITMLVVGKCNIPHCLTFHDHMHHSASGFVSTEQATCHMCSHVINM